MILFNYRHSLISKYLKLYKRDKKRKKIANSVKFNNSSFKSSRIRNYSKKKSNHNINNKNKLKNEAQETKIENINTSLNQNDINKKKLYKINKINNYKDSLIEKEDKECTFSPKLNDNYNKRHIHRIKRIIKKTNNSIEVKNISDEDSIYSRNQKWKNVVFNKKKIIKLEDKEEKFPFAPDINKGKNINLIFKDNDYSNYWLRHNKLYINRRLRCINNNQNTNNAATINSYLSNMGDKNHKRNIDQNNHSLDNNDQREERKIDINYIKKLLHEELQNTKNEDIEDEEINL